MSELKYQFLPNAKVDSADVLILPVPFENTVCYKSGTAMAPAGIISATEQLEYYEEDAAWSPLLHMNISVLDAITMDNNKSDADNHQQLLNSVQALPTNNLLIALGGEHSITPDIVAARMAKPGTIIQLDAHADLRPKFRGSEYSHACPMHRLREQGHHIIMAGIRSLFEEEARRLGYDNRISAYMDKQLQQQEAWQALLNEIKAVEGDAWLTVDMDAFDPALVPGVGTPQPGGLSWYQVIEILETLMYNPNIQLRGMDIVELVPEPTRVSEITAAKLMHKAISHWGKSKGYHHRPKTGSQSHVDYH